MGFLLPCFRQLKRRLGELDAACECVEIAVRELVAQGRASGDESALLDELSQKHQVRVNRLDAELVHRHTTRLYLVSVHQNLEEFLVDLRREHPDGASWSMDGDDDRLTKAARAVFLKPTLAFDLCQHYREIRNAFVHPAARSKLDAPDVLRELVARDASLAALNAPSTYNDVGFDDFVLFTRSAKAVANELCEASRPNDSRLASLALAHCSAVGTLGRLAENPVRLAQAMSGFLQTTYSLSRAEADMIVRGSLA